ncbi:hypothetical protein [Pseudonocardia sp. TRM90224]|uniref:hypothetical protein n=1 Tax=Pseudonocardia sp. TRM90224 TaxID=2812678 RepID=UPI001E5C4261|nr:hypothetical protein [Pseudonocardia sp. TRM90224]
MPPALIALDPDDHHAEHVGHTADGLQFFLTTPFVAENEPDPGREFVALFLFDAEGALVEARIDDFGPRASLDEARLRERYDSHLAALGEVTIDRIVIAPFSVERFGTAFGLIVDDDDDECWVTLEPGDYMAFCAPWDSGEYCT